MASRNRSSYAKVRVAFRLALQRPYATTLKTGKALWLSKIGGEFMLGQNAVPNPGPGEVLVKVEASALNPLDVRVQKSGFFAIKKYPTILGEDAAGVVQKVGDGVARVMAGDNVFFQSPFGNKYGSFQEYCLADAMLTAKMPPNLSFDQAASISVSFGPFAVATYARPPRGIGLTPPFEHGGLGKYADRAIVVFGGASSVGQFAIQLATLSGFSPIVTTASLHNRALLLSLGATHVFDRHLPSTTLKKHVRERVSGPLTYIFDAVSSKETQQTAYDLLAPGGTLAIVSRPHVGDGDDGSGKSVLSVMGSFHPLPNRALGAQFVSALTGWLAEGKIKPNHVEVLPGGLHAIPHGLERLADGVSATKLVVRPPETTE